MPKSLHKVRCMRNEELWLPLGTYPQISHASSMNMLGYLLMLGEEAGGMRRRGCMLISHF